MIAGINEILDENAALTTLLGSDKIYPVAIPEGVDLPFLATSVARKRGDEIKGNASGFHYCLVNVNVHAANYDDLESIEEAVVDALDSQSFTTSAGPYTFTQVHFENSFDRPDMFANTPTQQYVRTVQFNVIVKR